MKPIPFWLCALLASACLHGAQFEGRVHLQRAEIALDPGRPDRMGPAHDLICSIKGDKIRIEVVRERINSFITDTEKKETTVILEDDMAFIILPSLATDPDAAKLEKTGETETIHGHKAEKYLLESDEGKSELWLATDLGRYPGFGEGFEKPPKQEPNVDLPDPPVPWIWEYVIAGEPLFPLRVITRDFTGREIFRLDTRGITPAKLDDRLFLPSPNYKRVESWPETN